MQMRILYMIKTGIEHFVLKRKTRMSIFYQLNMSKYHGWKREKIERWSSLVTLPDATGRLAIHFRPSSLATEEDVVLIAES